MRIGVWGAGSIGSGLVYRLATTAFTSQLLWINRSYEKIEKRVVDIEHGLGFAPSEHQEILDCARREVVKGAGRVKSDRRSTLHPIVEGALVEEARLDRAESRAS